MFDSISAFRVRLALSAICLLLGMGVSVWSLIDARWLAAASAVLGGLAASLLFVRFWEWRHIWGSVAAVAAILGVGSILLNHDGLNSDLAAAQEAAMFAFATPEKRCWLPSRNVDLSEVGFTLCGGEHLVQMADAIVEIQKARLLDPVSSLVDQTNSAFTPPPKNHCAAAFRIAEAACPELFVSMPEEAKVLLRKQP